MSKLVLTALAVLAFVCLGAAAPNPDDVGEIISKALEAARSGDYRMLAACLLVGIVWAMRKWGSEISPFFATDRGGAVLALAGGFVLALASLLISGAPFSVDVLVGGFQTALMAAGGWAVFSKLFKKKPT
ncbi:MAG TPA: hypothetical protein VEJ18_11880 [Planctomycetota bacterium]|nr:hypothetical protein [Planctomycetota bacterium]